MSRASGISVLFVIGVALLALSAPALCEESAASEPDSSSSYRWGAVYTSMIDLREKGYAFPWNDPSAVSHYKDRVSLMFGADFGRYFDFFIKGTTGYLGKGREYLPDRPPFFIDQGHISARWRAVLAGKLFLRERVFRNRNRLILLVSNESRLIRNRGEGLDIKVLTAGPALLTYSGAVFRYFRDQRENGGLPVTDPKGAYLNLVEGGIKRSRWHAGITIADVRPSDDIPWWRGLRSAMYGIDGGFDLAGANVYVEYSRSVANWSDFEDDLFGFDFGTMKWGDFSAGLPEDGALAAEWTGLNIHAEGTGRFGITPGYRYSGLRYKDVIGEVERGIVESYIELWWKHEKLAMLVSLKAADRYYYWSGEGGGVYEASLWTRLRGGTELTARSFFWGGYYPALLCSVVDDNSLTRLSMTARMEEAGGSSEFYFLTEAGINLGRKWTLGGSVYLEGSREGFYSADIEMRGGKRFVFRASAGTYIPGSTSAALNYDPYLPETKRDRVISFYTRIWLGGI